jgi:ATP-dependent Clp protease ATP-binding subunit ClpC
VLERRFQPILVAEPSVAGTVEILAGLRDAYEAHRQARITDDALDAAAQLSARYVTDRFLPDKAIDLMDQAAARVRLRAATPADDVRELEGRLKALRRDKDQAVAAEDFDRAKELTAEIDRLRPELENARHGHAEVPEVTATDIAEVVSRRTGVPVARLTQEERDRLVRLEEQPHERVIGRQEAVRAVAEAVRRARAGLSDPDRPIGAFLFLGPTGVGKTELAQALAEALFGGVDHMVRLDMTENQDKQIDVVDRLTEAVRRRPHSVVLLDDIDKAHPDVVHVLLQLLDDGRLTDRQGRTVDFSNAIVIMTSRRIPSGDAVMKTLHETLRPELLNRIDDIVIFERLGTARLRQIMDLLLDLTSRRLRGQGVRLEVTDAAKDALVESGFKPEQDARPLRRTVERDVDGELSRALLCGELSSGDTATVDYIDGGLTYHFDHAK